MHAFIEARRAAPAVLYLPHVQLWWDTASPCLRATLCMLLADLPPELPLLLLAVADGPCEVMAPTLVGRRCMRVKSNTFAGPESWVKTHSTHNRNRNRVQALLPFPPSREPTSPTSCSHPHMAQE